MSAPREFASAGLAAVAGLVASLVVPASAPAQTIAVRGGTVHTVSGTAITDGVVLIEGGKIVAVGPASEISLPNGVQVLEAAVVTPGLVDARTVVGLAGYLNQDHDQDQLEHSSPIQPELRAIDAYDARERLIDWVRGFGVTTLHTGHGPGALVSGQTMVVKTTGDTVDEAVVVPEAMIAATLGDGATVSGGKSPGTSAKAVAMLRAELLHARDYLSKLELAKEDKKPSRDLKLEALGRVLTGELPLLVTAHRHNDLLTALRLQEEFGFRLVLDGAADAYLLTEELAAAGVPVIVHGTMARATGEREHLTFANAARLADAGITVAIESGFESYVPKTRVVLFEAAIAAAHGLGFDRALRAITLDAASIVGVGDRVGSLEPGKDGDLALYDGDPFEYTTRCVGTVIEGVVVAEGERR